MNVWILTNLITLAFHLFLTHFLIAYVFVLVFHILMLHIFHIVSVDIPLMV
jgi:hypothetical protein